MSKLEWYVYLCRLRVWEDAGVPGPTGEPAEEGGGGRGCGPEAEETTGSDCAPLPRPGLTSPGECVHVVLYIMSCTCF